MLTMPTKRRDVLKSVGAGAGLLAMPAIIPSRRARAQAGVVNVTTYESFLPQDFIDQFQSDTGIEVRVRLTDDQGKQFNMLAAEQPNPSTDLVSVAGHRFAQFLTSDLLAPLDTGRLRNWSTVNEVYRDADWLRIKDAIWGVPILMGCEGLTRNTDYIESGESWEVMFAEENQGRTGYIVSDFLSVVMEYLGYDGDFITYVGKPEEAQAAVNAARDFLIQHKNMVRKYYDSSTEVQQMFINEDVYLAQTWSGPAARLVMEGFPVQFTIPREGGFGFVYNFNIAKNAANTDNAYTLLDAILATPEIGAEMTRATGYISTFNGAEAGLSDLEKEASTLSQEQLERIKFFRSDNSDMKYAMIDRAVAEIKAA